ncbi:hypothetical protein [Rhodococcus sp. IEGM 1408]|uniref:hypothetical protein n=1 Tax=Rhodococcus sp. IEGM 1408 TaxID=3082220 RepID=UPI002955C109|nr:hypothetical protein [Rhodococcus sp. IEGM 1408]MDV8003118.1 hypothetical protein [Rhodococcus sp. IEGM 1408]
MWDPGTALLATAVVGGGALALPPVARGADGFCAVIGLLGVMQDRTWAPTVAALGLLAWFVGHWSFAVRHDARYRSTIALWVIDKTPLRWTIPRYWQLRGQRRQTVAR